MSVATATQPMLENRSRIRSTSTIGSPSPIE
jgi:hypothetical protein